MYFRFYSHWEIGSVEFFYNFFLLYKESFSLLSCLNSADGLAKIAAHLLAAWCSLLLESWLLPVASIISNYKCIEYWNILSIVSRRWSTNLHRMFFAMLARCFANRSFLVAWHESKCSFSLQARVRCTERPPAAESATGCSQTCRRCVIDLKAGNSARSPLSIR